MKLLQTTMVTILTSLTLASFSLASDNTKRDQPKKLQLNPEFKPSELPLDLSSDLPLDRSSNLGTSKMPAQEIEKKSAISVSTGCKTSSGLEYKAGEPGYESCLSQLQYSSQDKKKDGSGASVNFTFGN